nr:phospholipase-like protein [Tanacetum cinerariifolium]
MCDLSHITLHKRKVRHDAKREKEDFIRYTMTGFVWAFMIWILEAIPATHRHVHKQPTEKIPRALAWELTLPFNWSRCFTLFVDDNLAPPFETLTPTKAESENDWWKASFEYFEESRMLALEGDVRVSTLTQTVSSLQGTIGTLESRLLALEDTIHTHIDASDAAKDATKDTHLDALTTMLVPKDTHLDASDAAQESGHTDDELRFIRMEKNHKPNFDLPDLRKIKRNKYPIYTTFEKKKTDCYLDCFYKEMTCETSFWDILYSGGEKVDYLEQGKLDGLRKLLPNRAKKWEDMYNIMKKINDATGVVENIESNDYFCYF